MKTALLQMDILMNDREGNKKKVAEMMEQAVLENPDIDLFVLPELWTYPFIFGGKWNEEKAESRKALLEKQLAEYGENEGSSTLLYLSGLAKKYKVFLVAGSLPFLQEDGNYKNTTLVFDREGRMAGSYDKVHLCTWCGEDRAFQNGERVTVLKTEIGNLAPIICYDIRFPELARRAALNGANLLVVTSDFGHNPENPKTDIWRTLLKARAIENMMFVVACDRCGTGPESSYFGHSMIIDPFGHVLAEGDDKEGIIVGDIAYELVEEARGAIDVFGDRQPEVY